jgi:hypothetical protein
MYFKCKLIDVSHKKDLLSAPVPYWNLYAAYLNGV